MKLIFIFPFINQVGSPIKWLPLSVPTLIGNLKKDFPEITFHQIDLEEEVRGAISEGRLDSRYQKLLDQFVISKHDFIADKNLIKFKFFFDDVVDYLKLDEYDHYFFSFYNRNKTGIIANIILAEYLKRRYKDKKIILGGILGYDDDYTKRSFEEFGFIDSFVIGFGVVALKEILSDLLKNKKIKRIYKNYRIDLRKEMLGYLPDFRSFRSFRSFCYSPEDLESIYGGIKVKGEVETYEKIVFIPYFFSMGCFWSKCAYCGNSGHHKEFYYKKETEGITSDLVKLKEIYQTKYFIFFNNNFNFNFDFSKKLLKSFIKNKLDILWTDSFNLMILDEELIDLLAQAGCFRMDIGITTLAPKIQRLYNNILQDNKYLENLEKISKKGIWTHISLIANLPHQYSLKKDKMVLGKYMEYIDGVSLNYYRKYPTSELAINSEKYNLKHVNEKVFFNKQRPGIMPFIEKDFKGTLEERKELFAKNYIDFKKFFLKHKKFSNDINSVHLYLLGYLYNALGFGNKNRIKNIIANTKKYCPKA